MALVVCLSAAYSVEAATGQVHDRAPQASAGVTLRLQFDRGRTTFYVGEMIPFELEFSSSEHRKYRVGRLAPPSVHRYSYDVQPPLFVSRGIDYTAGRVMRGEGSSGPGEGDLDPAAKPIKASYLLNDVFRMETPGKYRISVTSGWLGVPVTSSRVEIEIVAADPRWQQEELARAIRLMDSLPGAPQRTEGCRIARFLGTDAANVEMAKRYTGRDLNGCDYFFAPGIWSARNRKEVLQMLERQLVDPDHVIGPDSIRTLAIVSIYVQHPEWYPQGEEVGGLWSSEGERLLRAERKRYAKLLSNALPRKIGAALISAQSVLAHEFEN